eukprot:1988268-Rhodomonas_salina.1
MSLRACYAMPGTDVVCGAMCLRKGAAVRGTDGVYGATGCADSLSRDPTLPRIQPSDARAAGSRLLSSYGSASRCPVLRSGMALPGRRAHPRCTSGRR